MIDVAHFFQAVVSWRSNPSMDVDFKALSEDMHWIEYPFTPIPNETWRVGREGYHRSMPTRCFIVHENTV
jgi:hypothetical protein